MRAAMDAAEAKLYERATNGDAASLEALLARYLPQLHAYVHARLGAGIRARESSMDVVQSVCRELLAARAAFDFHGEERFRAWLFTAALNKIREKHRFHGRAVRSIDREATRGSDAVLAQSFLTPSQDAVAAEAARGLQEALAALTEDHREVITLARVVGLPHRVIAEVTGRSEEAARQLLGRALVRLAQELRTRGIIAS
jgi:RNA polymerase sigma-70 factor (ECF subfamily)